MELLITIIFILLSVRFFYIYIAVKFTLWTLKIDRSAFGIAILVFLFKDTITDAINKN